MISAAVVFLNRRLRVKPTPTACELLITVDPSLAIRSNASVGPMSPEVLSTTASYEEKGFWLIL